MRTRYAAKNEHGEASGAVKWVRCMKIERRESGDSACFTEVFSFNHVSINQRLRFDAGTCAQVWLLAHMLLLLLSEWTSATDDPDET
jgi:hypothetical protein